MKVSELLEEQNVRLYLTGMDNQELLKLMEGIDACGQAVKSGADVETLARALVHPSLKNHTDDLDLCKSQIKQEIAKKLNKCH